MQGDPSVDRSLAELDWGWRSADVWPKCWAAKFQSKAKLEQEARLRFSLRPVRSDGNIEMVDGLDFEDRRC